MTDPLLRAALRSMIIEDMKSQEVMDALELMNERYSKMEGSKAAALATAVLGTVLGFSDEPQERLIVAAVVGELAVNLASHLEVHRRNKLSETIAANLNKTLFAKVVPTRSGQGFAVLAREYADSPWVQIDALVEKNNAERLATMMNEDDYARRSYIVSLEVDQDWGDDAAVQEG